MLTNIIMLIGILEIAFLLFRGLIGSVIALFKRSKAPYIIVVFNFIETVIMIITFVSLLIIYYR